MGLIERFLRKSRDQTIIFPLLWPQKTILIKKLPEIAFFLVFSIDLTFKSIYSMDGLDEEPNENGL
ncbi:hypothetical protein [Marinomonas posidonica]|uniref:hypothetical protein n=1 Tax=Marinomonas posidonica TaxID=936476 RepID=UPI00030A1AFF|nr:hypothetical protein [Marinomonas posidonica]